MSETPADPSPVDSDLCFVKAAVKTATGELAWWLFLSILTASGIVASPSLTSHVDVIWQAILLAVMFFGLPLLLAIALSKAVLCAVRLHCFMSRQLVLEVQRDA